MCEVEGERVEGERVGVMVKEGGSTGTLWYALVKSYGVSLPL